MSPRESMQRSNSVVSVSSDSDDEDIADRVFVIEIEALSSEDEIDYELSDVSSNADDDSEDSEIDESNAEVYNGDYYPLIKRYNERFMVIYSLAVKVATAYRGALPPFGVAQDKLYVLTRSTDMYLNAIWEEMEEMLIEKETIMDDIDMDEMKAYYRVEENSIGMGSHLIELKMSVCLIFNINEQRMIIPESSSARRTLLEGLILMMAQSAEHINLKSFVKIYKAVLDLVGAEIHYDFTSYYKMLCMVIVQLEEREVYCLIHSPSCTEFRDMLEF